MVLTTTIHLPNRYLKFFWWKQKSSQQKKMYAILLLMIMVLISSLLPLLDNIRWMSKDKVEVRWVHMDSFGESYFTKAVGRAYETVHVNKDSVFSLSRYYREGKRFPGLQQLIVRITPVQKVNWIEHYCVVNSLDSQLKDEEISTIPHGHTSKRTGPYICTSGGTMEKLSDNLSSGKSVTEVYDPTPEEPALP